MPALCFERTLRPCTAADHAVLNTAMKGSFICMSCALTNYRQTQVQDKALDVLSHHLQGNLPALHANLLLVLHASEGPATSVRKRAVDILWSCYITSEVYGAGAGGQERIAKLLLHSLRLFAGAPPPSS